jgi:hypothetical protein
MMEFPLCDQRSLGRTRSVAIHRTVPNIRSDRPAETRDFFVKLFGLEVAIDLGWVATVASPTNPSAQVTIVGKDDPAAPGISVEVEDASTLGRWSGAWRSPIPCVTRSGEPDASCFASRAARS